MSVNHSLLDFFINAGPVVKIVMLILLIASLLSWTFIFQRWSFLSKAQRQLNSFDKQFRNADNLVALFEKYNTKKVSGIPNIFVKGFSDYMKTTQAKKLSYEQSVVSAESVMVIEQHRLAENLDAHLSFLATVASTSPYIGLFGTVWGIMTAFTALGAVQQATIAMVAPGISEALIATALGLFAAIPAAIAYNRFTNRVDRIMNRLDIFIADFTRILRNQGE